MLFALESLISHCSQHRQLNCSCGSIIFTAISMLCSIAGTHPCQVALAAAKMKDRCAVMPGHRHCLAVQECLASSWQHLHSMAHDCFDLLPLWHLLSVQ